MGVIWQRLAAALVGATVLSTPACAQNMRDNVILQRDREAPRDDLLGIRVGTSAWQTAKILHRQGFTLVENENGLSWYSRIAEKTKVSVARPYRLSVERALFAGPKGERLAVSFVQTPSGAAISRMQLQFSEAVNPDDLRQALFIRYGVPNCDQAWCMNPSTGRNKIRSDILVRISADPATRTVTLDGDAQLRQLMESSITESVRYCRRSRLGVPFINPEPWWIAC